MTTALPTQDIAQLLGQLSAASAELLRRDITTEASAVELGERMRSLEDVKRDVNQMLGYIQVELPDRMEEDVIALPHGGRIKRSWVKPTRKWLDKERTDTELRDAIANRVALDAKTGEVNNERRWVAREVFDWVKRTWGSKDPLVGKQAGIYALGLNLDEHTTTSGGHYAVEVDRSILP